jgi:ZIP family zinc transporter
MAAPLRRGGLGAASLLGLVTASAAAVPLGALTGYALSSSIAWALPAMLALAAGALIYLTCNEIIPESHSHGHERRATFGLLTGFLIIMLLQVGLGHAH